MNQIIKSKVKVKNSKESAHVYTLLKEFGIVISRKELLKKTPMEIEWILKDVEADYKLKAKKYHPDIGGDPKIQSYYTSLYTLLKSRLNRRIHGPPPRVRKISPLISDCLKDKSLIQQTAETLGVKPLTIERLMRFYKRKLDTGVVI